MYYFHPVHRCVEESQLGEAFMASLGWVFGGRSLEGAFRLMEGLRALGL
tara:strand:+ start:211 stop:357 length:147 start_codon:yes stop_codon:yes gene_type:complete